MPIDGVTRPRGGLKEILWPKPMLGRGKVPKQNNIGRASCSGILNRRDEANPGQVRQGVEEVDSCVAGYDE
ncbi:uncharacterized protein N7503_000469 [Penicillium pulvis]|uniref:uncharacterized protein n=1 Tax=Penicillium pulvis TaxID=1562058 RepID=UPI002546D9DB|nr:uncharacterized protein N7503_000469 [Penicillium pulvis]KAJ5813719.1 hypothetical protein N7503_000469 [Penicillium pulvis]